MGNGAPRANPWHHSKGPLRANIPHQRTNSSTGKPVVLLVLRWKGRELLEKKREQKAKAGIGRKDISEALKGFYKESLEPKFDQIDKRFEQVDQRFEQIDQRFERVEKKLEEHDERFRDLSKHSDEIHKRFERIETEYLMISSAIDRMEKKLERLERIEEKLDMEITKREFLEKEILELKGRVQVLQSGIEEIENRLKGFAWFGMNFARDQEGLLL